MKLYIYNIQFNIRYDYKCGFSRNWFPDILYFYF